MAKKKYEEANIQAIATAIREKTGTEQTYNTSRMASGVEEVYEAGEQSGTDETKLAIWKAMTANGERVYYARTFYEGDFSDFTFPKPIKATGNAGRMFYTYKGIKLPRKEDIDLSELDVTSTSRNDYDSVNQTFGWASKVIFVPDYGIPAPAQYYQTFHRMSSVVEIEKIRSKETTKWDTAFGYDTSLTTVTIEGVIGTDFDIHWSPLSIASLKSIITHLKDYTGTDNEYRYTLTVKASAFEALEAEGATAEYVNIYGDIIPCTWAEMVDFLTWNLVKS